MRILAFTLACLGLLTSVAPVRAQNDDYPSRPVRIVVPFTPGSGTDAAARFFGERLSVALGQPVVVENKPGANGVISVQAVKQAPADGYTLLAASISIMSVNPIAIRDLPYDPSRDFKPVSGLTRGPNAFLVPADSRLRTLADFVASAKSGGKPPTVATFSPGYQLAAAWFANLAGFTVTNVPYKGQAPLMTDLAAGQVDAALVDPGGALPLIRSGKLRPLAVTGEQRMPELPDVPTVRESGYPDYLQYSWASLYVRIDTPSAVHMKLVDAMQKVMASPEARDFVRRQGQELMSFTPAEMQKFQADELARFRRVADAAGLRFE